MSNPTTIDAPVLPLAQLHLPPEPGIFPLAWGWWFIIAIAVLLLVLTSYLFFRRIRLLKAKKIALKELNRCQNIAELNILLKRAALSYFPKNRVSSLTAASWLEFLDEQLPACQQGFVNMQNHWIPACFSVKKEEDAVFIKAQNMTKYWLKQAIPPSKNSIKE